MHICDECGRDLLGQFNWLEIEGGDYPKHVTLAIRDIVGDILSPGGRGQEFCKQCTAEKMIVMLEEIVTQAKRETGPPGIGGACSPPQEGGEKAASIEDINPLADRVRAGSRLCGLFEGERRAREAETMVAQTLCGSTSNHAMHGTAFSFKGKGVERVSGGGLGDNATAYHMLRGRGYFVEGKHEDNVTIIITKKLVALLVKYFASKPAASPDAQRLDETA